MNSLLIIVFERYMNSGLVLAKQVLSKNIIIKTAAWAGQRKGNMSTKHYGSDFRNKILAYGVF